MKRHSPPVLPPEVWEMIFASLDNPKDLLSAMRVCTEWETILKHRHQMIRLQNVLPLVAKYLPVKSFLKCRQVCKPLKETIDKELESTHPLSSPEGFESPCFWWTHNRLHPRIPEILRKRYKFLDSLREDNPFEVLADHGVFMSLMDNCSGNPFIGKSATIHFPDFAHLDHYPDHFATAKGFLTWFGHHLNNFTHYSVSPVGLNAIMDLPSILALVPNLKSLELDWEDGAQYVLPTNNENLNINLPSHLDLFQFLRDKPFPAMKELTSLHFNCGGFFAISFQLGYTLLLEYGFQLTTLVCNVDFLQQDQMRVTLMNYLLPNLKNLRIIGMNRVVLQKLCQVSWNLERLQIHATTGSTPLGLNELMRAINNFNRTLVQLQVNIPVKDTPPHPHSMKVKLPILEQLSTVSANVNSAWFWDVVCNKCPNVEVLDFQIAAGEEFTHVATARVQFRRCGELAKDFFYVLPKLLKIRWWYQRSRKCQISRRNKYVM